MTPPRTPRPDLAGEQLLRVLQGIGVHRTPAWVARRENLPVETVMDALTGHGWPDRARIATEAARLATLIEPTTQPGDEGPEWLATMQSHESTSVRKAARAVVRAQETHQARLQALADALHDWQELQAAQAAAWRAAQLENAETAIEKARRQLEEAEAARQALLEGKQPA